MTNNITLSSDEDMETFLKNATAFNSITSAIAIFDTKANLVFQNNAFEKICTQQNQQKEDCNSVIFSNKNIIDAIVNCADLQTSSLQKASIPFNSKISLDINILLKPIIDHSGKTILIMLTIEEESISTSILKKVKAQEKYNGLANQIKKLTEINQSKNELIKTLLKKTPFAVIIFDENQQAIQSNEAATRLFTQAANEITGMHCSSFFYCHQRNEKCPVMGNSKSTFKDEVQSCNNSAIDSTFLRHSSAIKFNNKPAVLEAFIDISEKISYEQDLVNAILSADLANASKSEFLSNMSHELRTPLHAILSFSRFGIDKIDSPKEKILDYFKKIQTSGKTLLNLLNDLLDLSKLEAGKMELHLTPTQLEPGCTQVIDEFSELISEKNVNIITDYNSKNSLTNIDHERIKQVIRNLISNAVKFSPQNEIIVISTFTKNSFVYFCIDDRGPGVPDEELKDVFNKFVQSSKTKTGAGGTGLGLSICKEIISRHHGQIWAEKSNHGGRFLFKLPIENHQT